MNKYAIISDKVPVICDRIKKYGYKLIYTECMDEFISYEQNHADMQCLMLGDKLIVLKECKELQHKFKEAGINYITTRSDCSGKYPDNIKLNSLFLADILIGKSNSIDSEIIEFCKKNSIKTIDVKQGYTACSCTKINEKAIITTDESIFRALEKTDIDMLKISQEGIKLHGAKRGEFGFIGGASCLIDENKVLFFGDITTHKDYDKIKAFCDKHNVMINYIENLPLTDIGGCILLKN